MKIAILSESSADEAAVRILIAALRPNTVIEWLHPARVRPGGWTGALQDVAVTLKHLYYHTDGDALVTVLDSDDSPVHSQAHAANPDSACRVCNIQRTAASVMAHLTKPRPMGGELRIAIGLAVPSIEAWYLCGQNPHAAEAPSQRAIQSGQNLRSRRNELKRLVYGTDRPSLKMETDKAIKEATRLAADLQLLERLFPLWLRPLRSTDPELVSAVANWTPARLNVPMHPP